MIQIILLIFGILLIWIGINSLKKLKENNQKWAEIERTYIVPNDIYYEERKETFEEAKYWVAKFQKYIPILANMSISCGILSLSGVFFINSNLNFNLTYIGYASLTTLIISISSVYFASDMRIYIFNSILIMVWLDTRYKLLINLFCTKNDLLVVESVGDLFSGYIKNTYENYFLGTCSTSGYASHINGRIFALFSFYLGILLFLMAFIFDKSFYQMVISFKF